MSIHIEEVLAFRRFELVREEDVSGVSGTGVVALGVQFPDGTIVLRWNANGQPPSTVNHVDIDAVLAIHGHDGRTTVEWLDDVNGNSPEQLAADELFHQVLGSALDSHTKKVLHDLRLVARTWRDSHNIGSAEKREVWERAGKRVLEILDQPFPNGEPT